MYAHVRETCGNDKYKRTRVCVHINVVDKKKERKKEEIDRVIVDNN